ncbi:MAG: ParB N-terminal domain-containing protein [Nitratireductor sp.]
MSTLAIKDIHVPEDRLRMVKAEYAALLARSLSGGAVLPPITVRRTPNGTKKLTLVAGAHRLEAARQAGRSEIEAVIVKVNADQAREIEIKENLFRNELTALERITAVAEYRRLFDAKFEAAIEAENKNVTDMKQFRQVGGIDPSALNLLGLHDDSQEGGFYARATERLGISRRACERAVTIMKRLRPGAAAGAAQFDL